MNLNDLSTQLLFTTIPIWTQSSSGLWQSATAFIYNVPIPDKPNQSLPMLVTNYHVVQDAIHGRIELIERKDNQPNQGKRVRVDLSASVLLQYTNQELDIALIPLGGALNRLETSGRPAFFRSVTPDIIPTPDMLSELAALEEVVFIGYPAGLRDEANSNPLIRRGITSTPVWNDFRGRPVFLIDAGVFPGSSGSPVFIFNQGAYATKQGLTIGNRLLFLGIICEAFIGTVADDQKFFLGLGQVVKSTALKDFIDFATRPLLQKA